MRSGISNTVVWVAGVVIFLVLAIGLLIVAPTIQAREPAEKEWREYEAQHFPSPLFEDLSRKGYLTEDEIEKNNEQFEQLKPKKQKARNVIFSKHVNAHLLSNVPVFLVLSVGLGWAMWRFRRSSNG